MSLLFAALVATWTNTPALLAEAVAPVEPAIKSCMAKPHPVGVVAARTKEGATQVTMPVYGVGGRGYTPEERCLMKAVAAIALPPLPPGIERFAFSIPIDKDDAGWDAWRDLTATRIDPTLFAGCDRKARTVRVVLDRRRDRTRAWLPEWQFKGAPAIKACMTKALRKLEKQALLPATFGDVHLSVAVR